MTRFLFDFYAFNWLTYNKYMKNLLAILISLLIVANLGEAQIQPPVKIMPLGNSITYLDWQGGYRRLLKDSLVLGGFSTDFVGSNNYGQANWANPDYEHEGYGSATIMRAAGTSYPHIETATGRMTTYQPEIVIVELGTNDLYSGGRTPAMFRDDMRKLLDTIWSVNPSIKIVLNTIPPPDTIGHANFVPLWFNVIATNALFPALVSEKVAEGKTIVLADVYASFMPPESVKAYILDGVHPSYDGWNGHPVGGYRRMAKAIYPSVKSLIDGLLILPFAPILLSPLNGSTSHDTVLSLNWSPSNNASKYRLQISIDSGFISIVHDDTTITGTTKQISSLSNDSTYYWRVKAGNSVGWGEWSEIWSFTCVDPVSVRLFDNLPWQSILYDNYPNPFNPVTNFQFTIGNFQLTILKVFDLLGREVATLVNEVKQPGFYKVYWNASQLPSGLYYYRLTAGEYSLTKKLILLK
ncbi:MAG: hypothetical protein C0417_01020 [Chlorobiaceae bacterium]|nr:hypothetical protein [Chlorobiaceae bacterium]